MPVIWSPDGQLNVAHDPSDLPETASQGGVQSGALTRAKNVRLDERGKAIVRDGSSVINASAMGASVNWLEVQAGTRYSFAGTVIYENEVSLATGLTDAEWSAIQYSPYNDATPNVFALNGTDRKRIEDGAVAEWGIEAPTLAPTLSVGVGSGLTGQYNAKYTYVRKVDDVVVCESNPSPAADISVVLSGQSLSVAVTQPTDPQVTHIRVYRTSAGGLTYNYDSEIAASTRYSYSFTHDWEETDDYITGTGYHWSLTTDAVTISDGTGGTGSGGGSTPSARVAISDQLSFVVGDDAGYRLDSDGSAYRRLGSTAYTAISGEWLLTGSNSDYEARATLVSGSTPSTGTLDSWLGLGTDRTWTLTSTSSAQSVLTIEIRDATTLEVLDSATITLETESLA